MESGEKSEGAVAVISVPPVVVALCQRIVTELLSELVEEKKKNFCGGQQMAPGNREAPYN